MSECFNLSWPDFETCTSSVFKDLLEDELFTDVTLACEDNKQIKAHKVILSSCSSFFKNIFINNSHKHMLIYLKGVKMAQLTPIIRFVYLGETEVGQDDLDQFMNAAKGLEIRGLMAVSQRNEFKEGTIDVSSKELFKEVENKSVEGRQSTSSQFYVKSEIGIDPIIEGEVTNDLENSIIPSNILNIVGEEDLNSSEIRGKSAKRDQFPCEQCDYKASRADHLRRHMFTVHENGRIQCNHCVFSATRADNLKRHINRIHTRGNDLR